MKYDVNSAGVSGSDVHITKNVVIDHSVDPISDGGVNVASLAAKAPIATMTDYGTVEKVVFPFGVKGIRKFVSKDFNIPNNSNPPYFVEYPAEVQEESYQNKRCIPSVVEEALSWKLSESLKLKRGRSNSNLCITNGEECNNVLEGGMKRARIIAVIDGTIVTDATDMAEEAGQSMPPNFK